MNQKKLFAHPVGKTATLIFASVLIVLAFVIALNTLLGALPIRYTQYNLAKLNDYKLSGASRDWLKNLDTDVDVYLICTGGEALADRDLRGFLEEYANVSDRITVQVIDPRADGALITRFGGVWPSDNSVIVASEKRYRIIENDAMYSYYNTLARSTMSAAEYEAILYSYFEDDATGASAEAFAENIVTQFDGDAHVTNAVSFVSLDTEPAKVYLMTGNGAEALPTSLTNLMLHTGFDIGSFQSLTVIPEDCDLLVMNTPAVDITEVEKGALENYLARGGKLFLCTYYGMTNLPNLNTLLLSYGMSFEGNQYDYICESNPNYTVAGANASDELYYARINSLHPATGDFKDNFVVFQPHPIHISDVEGVTHTKWINTSGGGYLMTVNPETGKYEQKSERSEYTIAAFAEKDDTAIFWITTPYSMHSMYNVLSDNNGNYMLLMSAMKYLTGSDTKGITVVPTSINQEILTANATTSTILGILLVLVLPVAAAAAGITVWTVRKRR